MLPGRCGGLRHWPHREYLCRRLRTERPKGVALGFHRKLWRWMAIPAVERDTWRLMERMGLEWNGGFFFVLRSKCFFLRSKWMFFSLGGRDVFVGGVLVVWLRGDQMGLNGSKDLLESVVLKPRGKCLYGSGQRKGDAEGCFKTLHHQKLTAEPWKWTTWTRIFFQLWKPSSSCFMWGIECVFYHAGRHFVDGRNPALVKILFETLAKKWYCPYPLVQE